MDCRKRSCVNYDGLKAHYKDYLHNEVPPTCTECNRFHPDRFNPRKIADRIEEHESTEY